MTMYYDKLIISPTLYGMLQKRGYDMSKFEKWGYLPVTEERRPVFTATSGMPDAVHPDYQDRRFLPITTEGNDTMNAKVDSTNVSDASLEQEINAKGLNAPRVTNDRVEAVIAHEYYMNAYQALTTCDDEEHYDAPVSEELKRLTICVLVLKNGFVVTGEASCVDPANYDAEIGKKVARKMAIDKVWMLEGYVLRQQVHAARANDDGPSHD